MNSERRLKRGLNDDCAVEELSSRSLASLESLCVSDMEFSPFAASPSDQFVTQCRRLGFSESIELATHRPLDFLRLGRRLPHVDRSFVGDVSAPRFYPNSVWSLNMFLWTPRWRGQSLPADVITSPAIPHADRVQPRIVAGSVSAGVNRRLGLARARMADRIPGVPPRSAAHPWLCTAGLPGRRRAATKRMCGRARVEHGCPVDRILTSSSALLSPLSSLLSREACPQSTRPRLHARRGRVPRRPVSRILFCSPFALYSRYNVSH